MVHYTHSLTGRSFTGVGPGEFGCSVRGTWDDGTEGVIFPAETWRDGSMVWVSHTIERTATTWSCSCGRHGVIVSDDSASYACKPITTRDHQAAA